MALGTLITVLGSVVVALLGLAGVAYTARSAKAANLRTAESEAWNRQVESWRKDVEELRADREEDRRRHAEEMAEVRADLAKIKEEAREDRLARYELVTWARAVVALLRIHQIPFPPPPPGVADTDPGSTTAVSH